MTHNERVLALLSDGEPHSHRELYSLYVMAHSRISDLRKRGHTIECWREGDLYLYQLRRREPNEDIPLPEAAHPVFVGAFTTAGDAPSVAEPYLGGAVGQPAVSGSAVLAGFGEPERAAPEQLELTVAA